MDRIGHDTGMCKINIDEHKQVTSSCGTKPHRVSKLVRVDAKSVKLALTFDVTPEAKVVKHSAVDGLRDLIARCQIGDLKHDECTEPIEYILYKLNGCPNCLEHIPRVTEWVNAIQETTTQAYRKKFGDSADPMKKFASLTVKDDTPENRVESARIGCVGYPCLVMVDPKSAVQHRSDPTSKLRYIKLYDGKNEEAVMLTATTGVKRNPTTTHGKIRANVLPKRLITVHKHPEVREDTSPTHRQQPMFGVVNALYSD